MAFSCTICEQESTRICVNCTKDACSNHLCEKCMRCSDCCECEVPLENHFHDEMLMGPAVPPNPDPEPEPPIPGPEPDPAPEIQAWRTGMLEQ